MNWTLLRDIPFPAGVTPLSPELAREIYICMWFGSDFNTLVTAVINFMQNLLKYAFVGLLWPHHLCMINLQYKKEEEENLEDESICNFKLIHKGHYGAFKISSHCYSDELESFLT